MPNLIIKRDPMDPWWNNVNVWAVDESTPAGSPVNSPIVNQRYFLKTTVHNQAGTQVDGTVFFYWSTPAIGFTPALAHAAGHQVGTSVAVGVTGGSDRDKISTDVWTAPILTGGHACIMSAVVETGVNVLTLGAGDSEPRVGQHNLTILAMAGGMGMFHMAFEAFNPMNEGEEHTFTIEAKQAKAAEVENLVKSHRFKFDLASLEGEAADVGFTDYSACPPDATALKHARPRIEKLVLGRGRSTGYSLVGNFKGDAALIHVTLQHEKELVGGLSLFLVNQKGNDRN